MMVPPFAFCLPIVSRCFPALPTTPSVGRHVRSCFPFCSPSRGQKAARLLSPSSPSFQRPKRNRSPAVGMFSGCWKNHLVEVPLFYTHVDRGKRKGKMRRGRLMTFGGAAGDVIGAIDAVMTTRRLPGTRKETCRPLPFLPHIGSCLFIDISCFRRRLRPSLDHRLGPKEERELEEAEREACGASQRR